MHDIQLSFSDSVRKIASILQSHGYELYAVGGVVRDMLINYLEAQAGEDNTTQNTIHDDIDFATNATPEKIMEIFPHTIPTGLQHGTVTVLFEKQSFEITTYRIDHEYKNHRKPEQITFTTSLHEDLARRDFTINAMASDPLQGNIIDIFDGMHDLRQKVIRCVGEPQKRYEEDALRMMRALRFATKLNYIIEPKSLHAIQEQKNTIAHISKERICTELRKILCTKYPDKGLHVLAETQLLPFVFEDKAPSSIASRIKALELLAQAQPCTLNSTDELHRLAIAMGWVNICDTQAPSLLPICDNTAKSVQHNLKTLRCSNKIIEETGILVYAQQYLKIKNKTICININTFKLTVLLSRYGIMTTKNILQFMKRQMYIYQDDNNISVNAACKSLDRLIAHIENQNTLDSIIFNKSKLAIDGKILLQTFPRPSGKWLGDLIKTLHRHVMQHPQSNTEEQLLALAKQKLRSKK